MDKPTDAQKAANPPINESLSIYKSTRQCQSNQSTRHSINQSIIKWTFCEAIDLVCPRFPNSMNAIFWDSVSCKPSFGVAIAPTFPIELYTKYRCVSLFVGLFCAFSDNIFSDLWPSTPIDMTSEIVVMVSKRTIWVAILKTANRRIVNNNCQKKERKKEKEKEKRLILEVITYCDFMV